MTFLLVNVTRRFYLHRTRRKLLLKDTTRKTDNLENVNMESIVILVQLAKEKESVSMVRDDITV